MLPLFEKVKAKLIERHKENLLNEKDELIIHHVVNLLRTYASSGRPESYTTLNQILRESENRAIRNRAKHLMSKLDFYRQKNEIMSNLKNHKKGQSLHTTRLINLLNHHDLIMNRFAAEEIVREGVAEEEIQEIKLRKG